jgi:hypothetical protein
MRCIANLHEVLLLHSYRPSMRMVAFYAKFGTGRRLRKRQLAGCPILADFRKGGLSRTLLTGLFSFGAEEVERPTLSQRTRKDGAPSGSEETEGWGTRQTEALHEWVARIEESPWLRTGPTFRTPRKVGHPKMEKL